MEKLTPPPESPLAWHYRASYKPAPYPPRPKEDSAKYCRKCGKKQKRRITVIGPMAEKDCFNVPIKNPRCSDHPAWRFVGLGWLVSPPCPPDPLKPSMGQADLLIWYIVIEDGDCENCGEKHPEKKYRRVYGRIGLWSLEFKASRFPSSYVLRPG